VRPSSPVVYVDRCATAQSYTKTATGYGTITYSSACDLMVGASLYSGTTACNSASPGSTPPAQYFSGYVANATVYETALTASQITTQYYEMAQ
jgi:hypothetical protein